MTSSVQAAIEHGSTVRAGRGAIRIAKKSDYCMLYVIACGRGWKGGREREKIS